MGISFWSLFSAIAQEQKLDRGIQLKATKSVFDFFFIFDFATGAPLPESDAEKCHGSKHR